MKNISNTFLALIIGAVTSIMGCKNDGGPVSPVDQHVVTLTEPKGTAYTGDFFPLEEGHTCYYSGNANMRTKIVIPGENPVDRTTNVAATGMLKVLALQNIPLGNRTIQLYPLESRTEMQGQVVDDVSQFMFKDSQAVYIKAVRLTDGKYLEVVNPVYIKSRLVVGDSWETAPRLDMASLLASTLNLSGITANLSLIARAKFFVAGHESITLPIGTRYAMRLEEATDLTISGGFTFEGHTGTINVTSQLVVIYHLIADTGIVHQNMTGPLNMTISADGQTATVSININSIELKMTSVSGTSDDHLTPSSLSKNILSDDQKPVFKTRTDERFWKISQAMARALAGRLGL